MINLEHLENLPIREPMKRPYGWRTHHRYSERHDVDHLHWWKRVRRVLHNNIGKSFDMTFHYYCTQVPKYQQRLFLDEFTNDPLYSRWAKYYVDDNGNIQRIPSRYKKSTYKVYSSDYKVKYRYLPLYNGKPLGTLFDEKPKYGDSDEYEKIVVSGSVMEFISRRAPEVIADRKAKRIIDRRWSKNAKKRRKLASLEIFNKSIEAQKEALRKQGELDILKRNQAGFDENSFKGENYHGRKNKK